MAWDADVHKLLTGSDQLGQYPDTLVNRLMQAVQISWDEINRRGLPQPALVPGGDKGPYGTPGSLASDCYQQVTSRWGTDSGRPRKLAEAAQQLENNLAVLNAGSATGTVTPTPSKDDGGKVLWKCDLSKNDVLAAGYRSTPHNRQMQGQQIGKSGPPWPPPITTVDGVRCIKFQLPKNGMRIEVEPNHKRFAHGETGWFGFSFYLDDDFPLTTNKWQVIWQLHGNDNGSPTQDIQCHGGRLSIADNHFFGGAIVKKKWYRVVVWCSFADGGLMSVWVDGQQVLDKYKAGLNNDPLYLKCGLYTGESAGGTIYQAGHVFGTSYGAVA